MWAKQLWVVIVPVSSLCFPAGSPSPNSQQACVTQDQQQGWQDLFLSFLSPAWPMGTDLKGKDASVPGNDLPLPHAPSLPVLWAVLKLPPLLLFRFPCQSSLMILIGFTTSVSVPGTLPSKAAVNGTLEIRCVTPFDFLCLQRPRVSRYRH